MYVVSQPLLACKGHAPTLVVKEQAFLDGVAHVVMWRSRRNISPGQGSHTGGCGDVK
jgi:hypothetical protein